MEMKVIYFVVACALCIGARAQQQCNLFCGAGQICQYIGFQPTCVPYQGGFFPGGGWSSSFGRRGRGRFFPGGSGGWIDPTFGGGMVGGGVGVIGGGMGVGGVLGGGVGGVLGGVGGFPPVVGTAPNVGVVNPGGVGPAVVKDTSQQSNLNLNVVNTNVNQHDHSGGGGTQVNQPVQPMPFPVPF